MLFDFKRHKNLAEKFLHLNLLTLCQCSIQNLTLILVFITIYCRINKST